MPTNHSRVFNEYLQQFHNIKNKPHCIRRHISLSPNPITSNECLINFSHKVLNGKPSGPWSQLQLSSMCWTWMTISTAYHYKMLKKRKKKRKEKKKRSVHNVSVHGKKFDPSNILPSHLFELVRDLFQFNDPWILYTSNNQLNFILVIH